jgi:hypothetical protein
MNQEIEIKHVEASDLPCVNVCTETRAETTYTQQLLRTTEMKIIRAIHWENA